MIDYVAKSNPTVSVVMPAKNAENTIKEAVDSILNQTLRNFELIIVNDGLNRWDNGNTQIISFPRSKSKSDR